MGIQVFCARGCGVAINIDDETIEQARTLGVPLQVAHDICPRDQKVFPLYRVTIRVEKLAPKIDTSKEDPEYNEPELLTQVGETIESPTFTDAFDAITKSINKQWESVSKVRTVIEQ